MWIKIVDEETLPIPPCLGFWNDGKQTVLDSQNDCEYAVHLIGGKTITHWMPLQDAPHDYLETKPEQHTTVTLQNGNTTS